MNLVSVITPVHLPRAAHLGEAYQSLATQQMPDGWSWEWLVQEDGEEGALANVADRDPRISYGTGRHGGPAVARNLALARAEGSLVKVLDADDQLAPGALARDIAVLAAHPGIAWTTSRVLDLLPDGSTVGFEHDPPEGPLDGDEVFHHWRAHSYRASVHPATLCARLEHVLALGGWMALPSSGDTGLMLALGMVSTGYFTRDVGLLYRKWPGQKTQEAGHVDPAEWAARMRLIERRAEALGALWYAREVV
jgi:hypothetical protein